MVVRVILYPWPIAHQWRILPGGNKPDDHDSMIRAGVIGYGMSAKAFHLPLLGASGRFEVSAISTSREADALRDRPGTRIFGSADELIRAADLDLVVITAPNDVHFELARQSLQNGLHVVLEKPMVTSVAEARSLAALARDNERTLTVFHNRRWDGDFRTVSKLIAGGQLGGIQYFESHFDRFRPEVQPRWRERPGAGAGLWWDLGPHLVDQALCLFGRPEALTARTLSTREGAEVTDYFHVLLHYDSIEVVLHGSSLAAGPNRRFEAQGTAGSYIKYGLDPQEGQLRSGLSPLDAGYGIEASDHYGTLYTDAGAERIGTERGCYQEFYCGVADSITKGTPSPVTADEAITVIGILELAESSHREQKTVSVPSG